MMLISTLRFWANGWIEQLYLQPKFHFSYYGFQWVKPLGDWTYLLFIICGVSAIMVSLGWKYRIVIVLFFLSFTYIELMDKTTYLNHYYFISSLSFLLCFLPAGQYFSLDNLTKKRADSGLVPKWTLWSIMLMVAIVYFYAGLAKLHADWLLEAIPLKIWLPGRYDLPIIGSLLEQEWVAYLFSWGGAIYDLCIPFALLYKPTRKVAFFFVVIFHILTRVLFPIGMFPFIMIISALIFFDASFHERALSYIRSILSRLWPNIKSVQVINQADNQEELAPAEQSNTPSRRKSNSRLPLVIVSCFFIVQLLLPFRHVLYPGKLFWTEEGFRFSWRVMLMEKAGSAQFKVVDGVTGNSFMVNNGDFISSFQEKQMSTQPDFIVEYAHYLRDHFESQGHQQVAIYVDSYVALNGQRSKPYIDPKVDLTKVEDSFAHKDWILPFD